MKSITTPAPSQSATLIPFPVGGRSSVTKPPRSVTPAEVRDSLDQLLDAYIAVGQLIEQMVHSCDGGQRKAGGCAA